MINPDDATVTLPLGFLDAMAQAESVETVMSTAVRWLPQMVPAVRASGYFFDDGHVIHSAHWTTDSTDAPEFARAPEHLLDALGDTHHHVNLDAKTLADSEAPALRYLYRTGIRSLLVVPMVLGSEALGMLTIGTDTPQPYGKQHGQTLKIIGNCIAAQIQLMLQFRKTVRLAETDPLTGLANRTRLMRVLNGGGDSLHLADADGRQLALLHIDLDHFKAINDRLGHAAGDGLLCRVTKRMSRAVGPKDLIARVGGDEFIVVTRSDPGGQHVIELGHAVINALKTPFEIEGMKARIGASIGTTLATEPGVTATRLIANADLALYAAKASGRSRVRPYTPALRSANERRSQIMADLRAALEEEDAFDVFVQPVSTWKPVSFPVSKCWPVGAIPSLVCSNRLNSLISPKRRA
ncbi:MAG: sensor domain-containing diguanylate cyclase [Pseudomonadota bacterium]